MTAQIERFYAQGLDVISRPQPSANGMTMGFRVCQATNEDNAAEIARCLNQDDAMDRAGSGDMPVARPNQSVGITMHGERLIIAVGTDCLVHAVVHQPELGGIVVTDKDAFLSAVVKHLGYELGDNGTNLVHVALDKAALNAVESGCDGFAETAVEA